MLLHGGEDRTVLIVDDEEKIISFIASYLRKEGYRVHEASNGFEALQLLERSPDIDLVLLDWMMPGINGLETCRRLRTFSQVPVIFLTAKSDEVDKLIGLELGADDYITKPFSIRELEARIRVILRRVSVSTTSVDNARSDNEILKRGALTIHLTKHAVRLQGEAVMMTPTEFKILKTLAQSPGRVYSRLDLLEIALGEEYAGYERSIDTHIRNIRKKIENDFSNPVFIVTVHGVGYKFGDVL
ncbi:response regulator transcription factor [Paenibacillus sedimenti]|uniref:Response regulator transcription factor n=1 Tax=Paenibacillus sedimenti TaxID=2770274 RepID=A0A926QK18_9BACL|nr:response regulator transcription factor [Paenibacillus sedimenti]MBD0382135.1 response regulator transcription factor [Paenibacillus sedimenti]